jgi:predicted esterase
MSQTFHELQHEMFGLYGQGRYAEALELVRGGLNAHSDQRSRMTFWAACLECRLNRPEEALERLTRYVAEGGWMTPVRLANDQDLSALRGRLEFARLVETCEARREREAEELEELAPEPLLEPPHVSGEERPPLVMALHMMGGNAQESRQYWLPVTEMGALLATPQGTELMGPGEFGWSDETVDQAARHIETIRSRHPYDEERVVFGGASRGATHAVAMAVSGQPVSSRGFIAIVGAPPVQRLEPHLARARQTGVRGVFITGEQDFALPRIRDAFALLHGAGLDVRLEVVPGLGHVYPPDLAERLREALEFVLEERD